MLEVHQAPSCIISLRRCSTIADTLQPARQDYDNADVLALGTLVAGGKLSLLCADRGGTLRSFAYVNQHPKTWRGKRLLPLYALLQSPGLVKSVCLVPASLQKVSKVFFEPASAQHHLS